MKCKKCNNDILENAKFCGSCGNKIQAQEVSNPEKNGFFKKLRGGDFGLFKTYWIFGIFPSVVLNVFVNLIPSLKILGVISIIYCLYWTQVGIGIWRSASKYTGRWLWATLGRVASVLGFISIAVYFFISVSFLTDRSFIFDSFNFSAQNDFKLLETTKNPSDSQIIGNLYRNTKYNFRIKFPEGWKIEAGDGIHIVQKASSENNTISIIIQQFDLKGATGFSSIKDLYTEKEFVDTTLEGVTEKFSDVKLLASGETKIDNTPTYWVEYSANIQILDNTIRMTNLVYNLAKNDTIYSIHSGTASDDYDGMKSLFLQTVGTFVFEEPFIATKPAQEIKIETPGSNDDSSHKKIVPNIETATKVIEQTPVITQRVPSKATGVVTVYNDTSNTQIIVKNTRFVSLEGKIFRTIQLVEVPSEGSLDLDVIADQTGDEYNIPATTFVIPAFFGSPRYELIYGKSLSAMSGGI